MNERLEVFRRRHGVAAIGAATIDSSFHTIESTDVVGDVRRGANDAVAETDAWHIGSCAKALTAALYARLVEQDHAEWGARLVDLFPDLAESIDRGWSAATIDELLTCRSGLPANPDRSAMLAAYDDPNPVADQRSRAARAALADPPEGRGEFVFVTRIG